ncbi:hypothetical protein AAHA92_04774 [Salvia divinorum]|uniref:Uncharacterized protein n=1 Tax=Salvia divinorum TaxID=28513 RepID=A0ABD1I4D4_SALDI
MSSVLLSVSRSKSYFISYKNTMNLFVRNGPQKGMQRLEDTTLGFKRFVSGDLVNGNLHWSSSSDELGLKSKSAKAWDWERVCQYRDLEDDNLIMLSW